MGYYRSKEEVYINLLRNPQNAEGLVYSPYIGEYEFYKIFFNYIKKFLFVRNKFLLVNLLRNKFITKEAIEYGLLVCPKSLLSPYHSHTLFYEWEVQNITTEEVLEFFYLDIDSGCEEWVYEAILKLAFHIKCGHFCFQEYEKNIEHFLMINYDPTIIKKIANTRLKTLVSNDLVHF